MVQGIDLFSGAHGVCDAVEWGVRWTATFPWDLDFLNLVHRWLNHVFFQILYNYYKINCVSQYIYYKFFLNAFLLKCVNIVNIKLLLYIYTFNLYVYFLLYMYNVFIYIYAMEWGRVVFIFAPLSLNLMHNHHWCDVRRAALLPYDIVRFNWFLKIIIIIDPNHRNITARPLLHY
jgi:hypothetical protein